MGERYGALEQGTRRASQTGRDLIQKIAEARRERAVESSRYGKEVEDLRSALSSAEEKLSRALAGGSGPSSFRVAAVKYAALAEEGVLSHKQAIGKILTLGKKE